MKQLNALLLVSFFLLSTFSQDGNTVYATDSNGEAHAGVVSGNEISWQ